MVTARREKRAAATVLLRRLEAEHVPVEAYRPFEVGDFQVDVSDAHVRVDWLGHALLRELKSWNTRTRSGTHLSCRSLTFLVLRRLKAQMPF
jgi:hypothetical protein